MSVDTVRKSRHASFSYVGREGCGALQLGLGILLVGLIIGVTFAPSPDNLTEKSVEIQPAELQSEQTLMAPQKKPSLILASVTPTQDGPATTTDKIRRLKVRDGDTLTSIMLSAGAARVDAHGAVNALSAIFDPRNLRIGHRIHLTFSQDNNLKEMLLNPSVIRQIAVRRDKNRNFKASETVRALTRRMAFARGQIRSSLYKAAISKKVPVSVLSEFVRIYSWDVDFQREIKHGDAFEVAYERFVDDSGRAIREGKIIFAKLVLSGKLKSLYRFNVQPNQFGYFDQKGRSARRPLLRTPIDGARLSSRFGKRRHPVLGYTKVHRGVDFAAPRGTPIYAAGDGVVSYRGRKGTYGKYLRIRHPGQFDTAYGHMSRFKKGVTRGARVIQGQVIGYVGSTGRSTGPHLHYEILAGGRQVNPLTVKMPSGIKLEPKMLTKFQASRSSIDMVVANLQRETMISQR